jgi:endo-1,3(4)-beta-glucanase
MYTIQLTHNFNCCRAIGGGLVSCGCLFDGTTCKNKFPDCPAFDDPGLNFGNAWYNDMHFHYGMYSLRFLSVVLFCLLTNDDCATGYHIYAAAVVAHFDNKWGMKFYENILLYIRNIANPDPEDTFFTTWRHKDWYQGNSWASGIIRPPFRNGRNQESSSEAIAAYEGIALYGKTMVSL